MKKTLGLKLLCITIAASSLLAAIPMLTTSCSKDDNWNINEKLTFNTQQIMAYNFHAHKGTQLERMNWPEELNLDPTDPSNAYEHEMVVAVQSQFTAWTVVNSILELVNTYNTDSNSFNAYVEIQGVHVNKNGHTIKVDDVHYRYGNSRYNKQLTAHTLGWAPIIACMTSDKLANNGRVQIGSLTTPMWHVTASDMNAGDIPYMTCPLNYYDLNGSVFFGPQPEPR